MRQIVRKDPETIFSFISDARQRYAWMEHITGCLPRPILYMKKERPRSTGNGTPTFHNNAEIIEMTSSLLIEYFSNGEEHEKVMAQRADALFHKFAELYHFSNEYSAKMNNYRASFTNLRHKIMNRQYCPENIGEIAEKMNLSISYFQHLYKDFFGNSIHKDIIHARIEQAAHLLEHTDHSISEISRLCGYDNTEHFSRSFKKYKKMSPRNYRKTHIN